MDHPGSRFLGLVFLLQISCSLSVYISKHSGSLHQVLSEFSIIRPIRTDSEGRFWSASVSANQQHRSKRHAPSIIDTPLGEQDPPISPLSFSHSRRGRSPKEEVELFYNVTVFGQDLQLRLRPNSRLIAPEARIEWEESGHLHSEPIREDSCFYTGTVSNMEDTSVAISSCDGLAGMIRTREDEFFIEPLDQWRSGEHGEEEEEEGEQRHIVYRSSAIIKKPSVSNRTKEDYMRGPLFGSMNLTKTAASYRSARQRRDTTDEMFHIEVLLAVDYSLVLFHGRDHILKYLLTLMNIVNEIYQDHTLGANINIVVARIIMLSASKSQELISVGNPQKSLENVCGWSYLQQREQSHAEHHDHTIYLTRQEFGPTGMQGYAPVTGMCQLHRSCVLVLEDGFSSAFVAAHETGHVLGMEHDGEMNDCFDDVPLGSIMSPRVQASFYRYHWSSCSWRELQRFLHTYDCLRDDPFNHEWPTQPQLPGFQYSMDQQCRFDFGPGFSLCTAYMTPDPCKQLWCSDYYNPLFCKTKKGPPLDGTKCGPGKHCFKGFCIKLTPNLLKQHGNWGRWSPFGSCSRTCGGGVRFRTRQCDNPPPANGGRTCYGNSYEFQLCSQEDCPPLTDFREDQCKAWNPFLEHAGMKHHWLPYEHPDQDERCRLYCQSKETGAVVSMNRMVHDGTLCSYNDAYSICVRGECEHVGCDGQIASEQREDQCGVCGGDDSSCRVVKGNFTRSTKRPGYLKMLEIPKGARHLVIQEFKGTPHVLAVKNLETDNFFLNDEHEIPESRVVIEKGVVWKYNKTGEQETLQTTGPLKYGVILMVRSHLDSKVTVSYKYIIQDHIRSSLESNLVQEEGLVYEWALKRWSHCSKPCGGGTQYTRFGCRRKVDGKMVERIFCSHINKPRPISRKCNTETCRSPQWVTGDWEACSASCGLTGWQRRWVSCQQESSSGKQQSSVNSKLCGDNRPESKQTCNRFPCPASWRTGPWTPCSVSCGNGTQERQVACLNPEGLTGNCSDSQPIETRFCQAPPCSGDQKSAIILWLSRSNPNFPAPQLSPRQRCRGDRSIFCRMEALSRYCYIPGYRQMCCKSCSQMNVSNSDGFSNSSNLNPRNSSREVTKMISATVATSPGSDVTRDVISTPPPTSKSSSDIDYMEYSEFLTYDNELLPSEDSSILPTATAAVLTTTVTTAVTTTTTADTTATTTASTTVGATIPSVKTAPAYSLNRNTDLLPLITVDPNKTQEPIRTSDLLESSTANQNIVTTTPSVAPSSAPVSTKENNSVNEVQYQIVGTDSTATREQKNIFVPRLLTFHERTQNKRIQQLLKERQLQNLQRMGNRTRARRTPLAQVNRTRLRGTERRD
ncbi:PREDICTED: A disintegrin and metalloproteinase with thrombospondin motifs 2-like [Cyprinodon variegatus]|nr:PREDICTED: A disintegrin and metalloproteinase with thrombospondin motifs 2-like [Cyprinodon variegatus]